MRHQKQEWIKQNIRQKQQIYLLHKSHPMDSRIYFHQYRRPRYSNPTYVSTNVNHSINFFNDQTYQPSSYINQYNNGSAMEQYQQRTESGQRAHGYSLNKGDNSNREKFHTINASYDQSMTNNVNTARYSAVNPNQKTYQRTHERAHSNLSSYGSNSLSLNQNEIFNKQNSKYNIITMQPKDFDTSMRQHPKYTLQNKDELYYKRMADELQKKKLYEQTYKDKRLYGQGLSNSLANGQGTNNSVGNGEMMAGKHTYGVEKDRQNHSQRGSSYQPMNINPETITNQYKHSQAMNNKGGKQFNPKLLSQMDELISLS